jgi:hypothetical protein
VICQLSKSLAVMDSRIESIVVHKTPDGPMSVLTMVSRATHTADGDWVKIITNARKKGAVWCNAKIIEQRS